MAAGIYSGNYLRLLPSSTTWLLYETRLRNQFEQRFYWAEGEINHQWLVNVLNSLLLIILCVDRVIIREAETLLDNEVE